MVAIVHNSGSLRNALHYNENKVKAKAAIFIHSGNYPKDTELLGFSDKINRLERLAALNQQTKINSVHISLNFDSADTLDTEKLKEIADVYINKIGFGDQPYLVYQHLDAGHPHIHIVTTNIKRDGRRIELHNLARNQSMKASKEIEKEFRLIQALSKRRLEYRLKPVNVERVRYGRAETKRAITNVLDYVLPVYKYASLAELNAVLQQYNIIADRGSEDSRIYRSGGLVYRVLGSDGKKVGVPIKASLLYSQPTLKNIAAKFTQNEANRQKHKRRIINAIELSLLKRPNQSLEALSQALQKEKIRVVLRQNDAGVIYGLTYVDHETKCVFNGSHLGKQYSANGLQRRCNQEQQLGTAKLQLSPQISDTGNTILAGPVAGFSKGFEELLQPENNQHAGESPELQKFKRKRKRIQQRPGTR
jgi:hypothetical protein